MSELRHWLHAVVIVRDGSTSDGLYGFVTQIIQGSESPLTVTFWIGEGIRHSNYYSVQDVELTDLPWSDYLTRDSELRCVFDKHYTKQYYVCNSKGRDPFGFDTEAEAWAHWFQDEATTALHILIQEVNDGNRTSTQSLEDQQGTVADGDGAVLESLAGNDPVLGDGSEHAQSREHDKTAPAHGDHKKGARTSKRVVSAAKQTRGDR